MARPKKPTPTDAELKILRVMWQLGPATLRDIRDRLPDRARPSPSALADAMAAMQTKKYVRVVDERRPQKFETVLSQYQTYESIVDDLRKRIFGGSLRDLVRHAIGGKKSTPADLDELTSLVKELGEDQHHSGQA
jgi:BlaI family transcriptional regulator, penicillinase repressor